MAAHTVVATPATQTAAVGKTVAITKFGDISSDLVINLAIAIGILIVTIWLSNQAAQLARATLARWPKTHKDLTLQGFVASVTRYAVMIIGFIAVLRRLGVETASIIAVLGAASLAVGLALQGALTNVAAGVMLLLLRPYQVGDVITVAGKTGTVARLDLFNTEMRDGDNLKIMIPNSKAFGDVIVNYTDLDRRRAELTFGIGYDDDIGKAIELALDCCAQDPRILKDPAPWADVTELQASTVGVTVRAWASRTDYWNMRYALIRRIKETFDREGVSLPFPGVSNFREEFKVNEVAGPPKPNGGEPARH
jgi:small conductance mechanosensitive channel